MRKPIIETFFEPERKELVSFMHKGYKEHKAEYKSLVNFLIAERIKTDRDVMLFTLPNLNTISYGLRDPNSNDHNGYVYSYESSSDIDDFYSFFISAEIRSAEINKKYVRVLFGNTPSFEKDLLLVFPTSNEELVIDEFTWCVPLSGGVCLACANEI